MNAQKEQKDRRMAAFITAGAHLLLLIIFLFFGLTYLEPKPEEGIAVNFGFDASASGSEYVEGPPAEEVAPINQSSTASSENPVTDEVATQDVVDAPSIENRTESGNNSQETEQQQPQEQRQVDSRLNQLLNNPKSGGGSSEGVGEGEGDMGDPNGNINAPHGTGGGLGGDGNYRLGSRKALQKPLPDYDCTEEGRVVVLIRVNRTGKVTFADPGRVTPDGVKSTTAASCLLNKARTAAIHTTWQEDPEAAEEQIGYIIYNFQKR